METVEKMGMQERRQIHNKHNEHKRELTILALLAAAVLALAFCCLFAGSSHMSFGDCLNALLGKSTAANNRILWNIRIPRVLAALIAGAGLSVSGLIMQTNLNNPMASPSTLGVSNAAVFGANLSIIAFSGGFLSTGNNPANYGTGANPYSTSLMAFGFYYTIFHSFRQDVSGLFPKTDSTTNSMILPVLPLSADSESVTVQTGR